MNRLPLKKALAVVLFLGVVAAGALLIRYQRGRVEYRPSLRSLHLPVRDTTAEEYAVYSTIIDELHHEERLWSFVVRDHTAPCLRKHELCEPQQVSRRLPALTRETLNDYLVQNQEPALLVNTFTLPRPVTMLSDPDLQKLLIRANLNVNLSPVSSRKISWGMFYERNPLSPGMISLSRVGFDSQLSQALVYEEVQGNDNGTWGRYIVLKKEGQASDWIIQEKIENWFPEEPLPSLAQGEWGTLKGLILDAKAEGIMEIELSSILCGWDIGNLNQVLRRDTIVVAEVIGKKTFAGTYDLRTWYKFKTVETLSQRPIPKYLLSESWPVPPEEVKPLVDEFVIVEVNGEMEIDGIRVIQYSNSVAYSVGSTYLLFLHMEPSKRVAARSGTDPLGVFRVGEDGTFSSYIARPYPLRNQMAKRFGNSINNLRSALKN